jgi:hypothetical protein
MGVGAAVRPRPKTNSAMKALAGTVVITKLPILSMRRMPGRRRSQESRRAGRTTRMGGTPPEREPVGLSQDKLPIKIFREGILERAA